MIKVLIAEDSPVVQKVLASLLSDEEGIEIVDIVDNGADAVERCRVLRPDLVTMDIFMPGMDGLEATRKIMAEFPTRIVIISSMVNAKNLKVTFDAMHSGAVEVIAKPHGLLLGKYDQVKQGLIRVVRQIMEAHPVRRFSWTTGNPWEADVGFVAADEAVSSFPPGAASQTPVEFEDNRPGTRRAVVSARRGGGITAIPHDFVPEIICIGGSTGAPAVLSDMFAALPGGYPIPIVAAQHMVGGFMKGMADWLDSMVQSTVKVASDGDRLLPGQILLAPDDRHLEVLKSGRVKLVERVDGEIHVPSVDRLFGSAAKTHRHRAMGIILSGMGRDGSRGLLEMRKSGAITLAQNEQSSVVYGMPRVAVEIGAVLKKMNPAQMTKLLIDLGKRAGVSG